jgi:hypothetical protein
VIHNFKTMSDKRKPMVDEAEAELPASKRWKGCPPGFSHAAEMSVTRRVACLFAAYDDLLEHLDIPRKEEKDWRAKLIALVDETVVGGVSPPTSSNPSPTPSEECHSFKHECNITDTATAPGGREGATDPA